MHDSLINYAFYSQTDWAPPTGQAGHLVHDKETVIEEPSNSPTLHRISNNSGWGSSQEEEEEDKSTASPWSSKLSSSTLTSNLSPSTKTQSAGELISSTSQPVVNSTSLLPETHSTQDNPAAVSADGIEEDEEDHALADQSGFAGEIGQAWLNRKRRMSQKGHSGSPTLTASKSSSSAKSSSSSSSIGSDLEKSTGGQQPSPEQLISENKSSVVPEESLNTGKDVSEDESEKELSEFARALRRASLDRERRVAQKEAQASDHVATPEPEQPSLSASTSNTSMTTVSSWSFTTSSASSFSLAPSQGSRITSVSPSISFSSSTSFVPSTSSSLSLPATTSASAHLSSGTSESSSSVWYPSHIPRPRNDRNKKEQNTSQGTHRQSSNEQAGKEPSSGQISAEPQKQQKPTLQPKPQLSTLRSASFDHSSVKVPNALSSKAPLPSPKREASEESVVETRRMPVGSLKEKFEQLARQQSEHHLRQMKPKPGVKHMIARRFDEDDERARRGELVPKSSMEEITMYEDTRNIIPVSDYYKDMLQASSSDLSEYWQSASETEVTAPVATDPLPPPLPPYEDEPTPAAPTYFDEETTLPPSLVEETTTATALLKDEEELLPPPLPEHPSDYRLSFIAPDDFVLPPPSTEYDSQSMDDSEEEMLPPPPSPPQLPPPPPEEEQSEDEAASMESAIPPPLPPPKHAEDEDDFQSLPEGVPPLPLPLPDTDLEEEEDIDVCLSQSMDLLIPPPLDLGQLESFLSQEDDLDLPPPAFHEEEEEEESDHEEEEFQEYEADISLPPPGFSIVEEPMEMIEQEKELQEIPPLPTTYPASEIQEDTDLHTIPTLSPPLPPAELPMLEVVKGNDSSDLLDDIVVQLKLLTEQEQSQTAKEEGEDTESDDDSDAPPPPLPSCPPPILEEEYEEEDLLDQEAITQLMRGSSFSTDQSAKESWEFLTPKDSRDDVADVDLPPHPSGETILPPPSSLPTTALQKEEEDQGVPPLPLQAPPPPPAEDVDTVISVEPLGQPPQSRTATAVAMAATPPTTGPTSPMSLSICHNCGHDRSVVLSTAIMYTGLKYYFYHF